MSDIAVPVHDGGSQGHQRNDAFEHLRDGDSGRFDRQSLPSLDRPRRQTGADGESDGQGRNEQNPGQ